MSKVMGDIKIAEEQFEIRFLFGNTVLEHSKLCLFPDDLLKQDTPIEVTVCFLSRCPDGLPILAGQIASVDVAYDQEVIWLGHD